MYSTGKSRWRPPSQTRSKTRPQYALDYHKYTVDELQTFIFDRTGKDPVDMIIKKQLCRRLQALDRRATFRFLDLPGEIREMIYRELLDPKKLGAEPLYTQILRTSRAVLDEAAGIVHERCATFVYDCPSSQWPKGVMPISKIVQEMWSAQKTSQCPLLKNIGILKITSHNLPLSLEYAETIRISLTVRLPKSIDPFGREVNPLLYGMVSRTARAPNLSNLKISHAYQTSTVLRAPFLFSLSKLDCGVNVKFLNMPDDFINSLGSRPRVSPEHCDIAELAKREANEAQNLLHLPGSHYHRLEETSTSGVQSSTSYLESEELLRAVDESQQKVSSLSLDLEKLSIDEESSAPKQDLDDVGGTEEFRVGVDIELESGKDETSKP